MGTVGILAIAILFFMYVYYKKHGALDDEPKTEDSNNNNDDYDYSTLMVLDQLNAVFACHFSNSVLIFLQAGGDFYDYLYSCSHRHILPFQIPDEVVR